jgi:mono/diheme cytochrome c family protein
MLLRAFRTAAVVITGLLLAFVLALVVMERGWKTPEQGSPREYFLFGSTGTELMPLTVFQVLPDLFPQNFQPGGKEAGDWVDQFGFIRDEHGSREGLPIGISVSNYRPKSGAPSPVPFVGFNCAVCHASKIRVSRGDEGVLILGMGNPSIDLVAFGDAIKTSILDQRLTPATVEAAYETKYRRPLSFSDKVMIPIWLTGVRAALVAELPMRDLPFTGKDLRDPDLFPAGPGRNQPMLETVRFLIHRTPKPDGGSSKIPSLYGQAHREWAQFDGSLRDPLTRNSLAALGVGASIQNLQAPIIARTVRETYSFVKNLEGPRYVDVFPAYAALDMTRVSRGRAVYQNYCADCHGAPGQKPGEWTKGRRQGDVIAAEEIGTDPARVSFRYYRELAQLVFDFFPPGHPLKPRRTDIRPNPKDVPGFINAPIESAFSRAPYLHNGSIATLAELINLKQRRAVLYRGANLFDPIDVGLLVPDRPDSRQYFRFDTSRYGNTNRGHDYPWPYRGPGWNEASLRDLLEYLKTL